MRPESHDRLGDTGISEMSIAIDHQDLMPTLIEEIRREALGDEADASPPGQAPAEKAETDDIDVAEDSAQPGPEPAGMADETDDDVIPLAPEDQTDDEALRQCPVCFHRYPPSVGTCANCGFDEKVGIQSSRFLEHSRHPPKGHYGLHEHASKSFACPSCGYDMTGAMSLKCPECGHIMPTRTQLMREELARQTEYESYHTPAVFLAIGLVGLLILGLIQWGWPSLVVLPTVLLAQVTSGMIVMYLCMFFWIGFDAPFKLNLLRLSAASAASLLAGLIGVWALGSLLGTGVFLIAYLILFLHLLDFEFVDAAAIAILTLILGMFALLIVPGFIQLFI